MIDEKIKHSNDSAPKRPYVKPAILEEEKLPAFTMKCTMNQFQGCDKITAQASGN